MNKQQIGREAQEKLNNPLLQLADARGIFYKALEDGAMLTCPCCDKLAKIYRRKIYRDQVSQLAKLFQKTDVDEYAHISLFARWTGDFAKLEWWGLVEPKPKDSGILYKRKSGLWRVTLRGRLFIQGLIEVPKYAVEYNGNVLSLSDEYVSVSEAYGEAFNFQELMESA